MQKKRLLPIGIKRLDLIELPGHVALLALDQPWCKPEHLADLGAHLQLAEELSKMTHNVVIRGLIDRAKIVAQASLQDAEAVAEFRRIVGVTLPWVSAQKNSDIDRASRKLLINFDKSRT